MRKIAAIGFCFSFLLLAEDPALQPVQVTKTEHMDFPADGLLRLNGDFGDVTIEGWDQPGVEITTKKTTQQEFATTAHQAGEADLDQVRLTPERHGNELILTVTQPRKLRSYLDAHIFVPRSARLTVHGAGQLYIDDIAGEIQAYVRHGTIVLHLPEQGHYDFDASAKWGTVNSDFPGEVRRRHWFIGHSYADQTGANPQKLHLRAGYGDIVILRSKVPQEPAAVKPAS